MIYSFVFFLALFVLIGVASYRFSQPTVEDYLLASKNVKPWLAGLSTFSTENSAAMFVGYIGLVYTTGVSALWLPIGWYTGEVLAMAFAGRQWRARTEEVDAHTYSSLLARWTGQDYKYVRYLVAIVTIVFLSAYAAAQFGGGGKALNVLTGWDVNVSAIIGFVIVVAYCMAGGIRASIWTDALQTVVMVGSTILIVVAGLQAIGGVDALFAQLNDIDPALTDMFSGSYKFGLAGFALGWLFAGIGVLGQPHVMVRMMVIDRPEGARTIFLIYGSLVAFCAVLWTAGGLCARVLLPELLETDPELGLPMLAAELMPGVLSGLFLAGLFAAVMSTADSQILASSAALTRDLITKFRHSPLMAKGGTLLVASFALSIALTGNKNVLDLVIFAWSFMATGFAPLIIVYVLGKKPPEALAIIMILSGMAACYLWDVAGFSGDVYNVLPGILTGLLVYFVLAPFMKTKA